jgi:hypothetical protein
LCARNRVMKNTKTSKMTMDVHISTVGAQNL